MKTKLLKKVRNRFEVNYYPSDNRYHLQDSINNDSSYYYLISGSYWNKTKQACLNTMMEIVRLQYRKYSRKYKQSLIKTKVWHS